MFSRYSAEQVLAEHAVAFGKHCNIAARVGALVAKKTCSFTLSSMRRGRYACHNGRMCGA